MIIIGEKINSTLKAVRPAIETYDSAFIQDLAKRQQEAGAAYIDVNAGMFINDEPEKLEWLVKTVQEAVDAPLCLDSPNPAALESALKANKKTKPLINSITDEKERYNSVMPLVVQYKTSVIALCMDDTGMPETADDRVIIAERLIGKLNKEGVATEDIFIDPMVRPIGTGSHYGVVALETIRRVRAEFPEVHITSGLSNISFGLPMRKLVNQAFMVAAVVSGMDSAIMDPLDKKLMSLLSASEALAGKDDYCMEFLAKFRGGLLEL